ncbi:MAG: dTDP-4-dehydrorhamnose reductase [Paracoccaceae bacterium]|nr:dTDP-4-dehydrorhamnose reductase [Paracoccaceae bacterium]
MRILVFGKTGQVARELARAASVRGIEATFLDRANADLTKPLACAGHVSRSDADVIINAAAYTAVDRAEEERALAREVNAAAPTAMARLAAERGIPLLHVSTDYVFDGSGTRPWREDARPHPQGVYGRTKLGGETGVAAFGGPHVILRTSWVFSAHGNNFVRTMLRLGAERDTLNVVDDQRGGPTPAAAIADALLTIATAFHQGRGVSGIFHFSGRPAVSWADFAEAIFQGRCDAPTINRIPTSQYPTPAKRPANSVLDCSKIFETYGIEQPDWRVGLRAVLAELEGQE